MEYKYTKKSELSFVEAVAKVKHELSKEGFGVLSEIDVRATLKAKLGVEYGDYVILGACNPSFAYQALMKEKDVGLFMPCNVIVYEEKGGSIISAAIPAAALVAVSSPDIGTIIERAGAKLKKVVENV